MTLTHLSHYGLTEVGRSLDNVVFTGTLGACRRMAFAHGMEVEKYEGRTIGMDGRTAFVASADAESFSFCWFKGGGFIQKAPGAARCLVMPLSRWLSQV